MTGVPLARRWHMGIHDAGGLLPIVLACLYLLALGLAIGAFVRCRRSRDHLAGAPTEARTQLVLARVWVVVTAVLFVLLVNRVLDLQTGALDLARRVSYRQGWYFRRRQYQAEAITALIAASMAGFVTLTLLLRRVWRRVVLVVAGVIVLTLFTIVRAISFHYVDHFLETGGRFGVDAVIEVGLLVLVAVGAVVWHVGERRAVAGALAPSATAVPTPHVAEAVGERAALR